MRSPVWTRVCRARCPLVVKARSHVGQTCFFFCPAGVGVPPPLLLVLLALAFAVLDAVEETEVAEEGGAVGDASELCGDVGDEEEEEGGGGAMAPLAFWWCWWCSACRESWGEARGLADAPLGAVALAGLCWTGNAFMSGGGPPPPLPPAMVCAMERGGGAGGYCACWACCCW